MSKGADYNLDYVGSPLFSRDDDGNYKVDYPDSGLFTDWGLMAHMLSCKPKDTFTLIADKEGFEELTRGFSQTCKTYGKVLWHSSNSDVATVNKNGKVTVKSEGYAMISAGIMMKATDIHGDPFDHEVIVCYHHIFSGPVLQLSKTNVKAVAKNASRIYNEKHRYPIIRTKGSEKDTEELIAAFVKTYNKYGNKAGALVTEIGNFTYWW